MAAQSLEQGESTLAAYRRVVTSDARIRDAGESTGIVQSSVLSPRSSVHGPQSTVLSLQSFSLVGRILLVRPAVSTSKQIDDHREGENYGHGDDLESGRRCDDDADDDQACERRDQRTSRCDERSTVRAYVSTP